MLGVEDILTDGDWGSNPLSEDPVLAEPYFSFISNPKAKPISPFDIKKNIDIIKGLNNPQFTPVFLQIK